MFVDLSRSLHTGVHWCSCMVWVNGPHEKYIARARAIARVMARAKAIARAMARGLAYR